MNISIQTSPFRVDVFGEGFDFSIGWGTSGKPAEQDDRRGERAPVIAFVHAQPSPSSSQQPHPAHDAGSGHHANTVAAFRAMIGSACDACVDAFAKIVGDEQDRRQANMS